MKSDNSSRLYQYIFLFSLFISGFAGLLNQVVWQRAIKIYLGGAEAICSMLVVLVFMLGLGLGSLLIGKRVAKIKDPLLGFGIAEVCLFLANVVVLLLLRLDLSESIFAMQRAAIASGFPIKVLYSLSGMAILIVPCSIMGMTMPLASEGANRQLKFTQSWLIDLMFFVNTIGAFFGALLAGFKLLPMFGQTTCLVIAALLNLLAAALVIYFRPRAIKAETTEFPRTEMKSVPELSENKRPWYFIRDEEIATFFMGFVSLAYEMYLFRTISLIQEPLPYTFSTILSYFLITWSIGVLVSGHFKDNVVPGLVICAFSILTVPYVLMYDRLISLTSGSYLAEIIYYVPCMIFGFIFGQLLNRFLKNWGSDVGRFMGLNTLGASLGIAAMTIAGGHIYHAYNAAILAIIVGSLAIWLFMRSFEARSLSKWASLAIILLIAFTSISLIANEGFVQPHLNKVYRTYSDPVGVTEITNQGDLIWDGLWHSKLTSNNNHVGTKNWMLAVVPALCLQAENINNALVIGVGTGITIGTIARHGVTETLDGYEINNSLKLIMRDFPNQTMNVLTNPSINIIWQDARSGLALNEKKYQLITQQPLYLKQAGSSTLLSKEYLALVSSRLTKDGVFLVYANSMGNMAQNLVVRNTLEKVFPHVKSFLGGYMFVASNAPITFTRKSVTANLSHSNKLWEEVKKKFTIDQIMNWADAPNDSWKKCPLIITDDHPVLEYPDEILEMSKTWN